MIPMSDEEEELNIWEPAATQSQTLESLSYFNNPEYAKLSKKEKKLSMVNFYNWLDAELSGIVRSEQAAMDALF